MNAHDLIPAMLLALLCLALTTGAAITLLLVRWRRKRRSREVELPLRVDAFNALVPKTFFHRPNAWIAVKCRSIEAVQTALHLHNPRPCTWIQGLSGEFSLFIAPPINGWIVITGSGLPDPADDIDLCFRFLSNLSRKLGQIHFFSANSALAHHTWVKMESGRTVRAYSWAGRTLWNQGPRTKPEISLEMKCFHYFESPEYSATSPTDACAANTEKLPQLAALWSIDPASVDEQMAEHVCGITGESPRLY